MSRARGRTGAAPTPDPYDNVARGYDRLVDASPGYHDHLLLSVRRMGLLGNGAGLTLLDLGCGTGASAAALLRVAPKSTIVGVDSSAGMLARARSKQWPGKVRFVHARLERLAEAGVHGPFDGVFAAFVMAELADPDAALRTVREVLRPGAPFAVHERSVAGSLRSRMVWSALCWGAIIPVGGMVTGDAGFYRDLWRAAGRFDSIDGFERRLGRAGFVDLRTQTVPGWEQRIVHTWLGRRAAVRAPDDERLRARPPAGDSSCTRESAERR